MNLQYIKNTEPPPAQSVLQYSISPDTVYVSTNTQQMYANLTITVFNPQSDAINCQAFQFGFYVGATDGDLTTETTGIQASSGQSNLGISTTATESPDNPTLYYYTAPSSGMANVQLDSQASFTFSLDAILINDAVGTGGAPIYIEEVTGTDENNPTTVQGQIVITKETPTLSIQQFSVSPPTPVSPGSPVALNWEVTDSDHWQLYDTDTSILLYDSESSSPPDADSYTDYPEQTTTYELLAWAGQLFTAQQATAMVSAPMITSTQGPSAPVNALSEVTISFTCVNATTVTLDLGEQAVDASNGSGQFTVQPAANTTYTLTAYNESASPPLMSQPVQVNVVVNPPSITSFTATPQVGATVTLAWETVSASSASLGVSVIGQQGITNLGSVDLNSSGYEVTPTGISTYILTAESEAPQATAQVLVIEDAWTTSFTSPSGIVSAGDYIWVSDYSGSVTVLNASDGTLAANPPFANNPITMEASPYALAYDGTYIWVAGYGYVSILNASDGSLAGSPFNTNPIAITGSLVALAYDGTYIWVANQSSDNVTVLNASDGSLAGNPPFANNPITVGNSPSHLAYDGTYIWVANEGGRDSSSISVLNASDGSLVGNPPFPDNPIPFRHSPRFQQSINALLYAGGYIWVAVFLQTGQTVNNVYVLDPSDGSLVDGSPPIFASNPITVGKGPSGLGYDGTHIWVANYWDYTISLLLASDGTQVMLIPTGQNNPYAFAFDGTYMWVLYSPSSSIMKGAVTKL